jgi:hypothetical protein
LPAKVAENDLNGTIFNYYHFWFSFLQRYLSGKTMIVNVVLPSGVPLEPKTDTTLEKKIVNF